MSIKDGIGQLADAAGQALRGIRTASNMTNDPEIMKYDRLTSEDFIKMSQDFGGDSVLDFIKEMELRRMKTKA